MGRLPPGPLSEKEGGSLTTSERLLTCANVWLPLSLFGEGAGGRRPSAQIFFFLPIRL